MIVFLENFFLKVAAKIARFFFKLRIRPIYVTVARFLIAAPLSLYFFTRGKYLYNVIGLFLYMALAILDWVDGRLAELMNLPAETKPLGKLVDRTLDRILMLIVLGSIFYTGITSCQKQTWGVLVIMYYSIFFFLAVLLYEFDRMFNLEYEHYPEIGEKMKRINKFPGVVDRFLLELLCLRNSLTRFCFMVSYPLFLGIIFNQLLFAFAFITLMAGLRALGLLLVMYRALGVGETGSVLTIVLRRLRGISE